MIYNPFETNCSETTQKINVTLKTFTKLTDGDIYHIFIDDNCYSNSTQKFLNNINSYIGKNIKLYIIGSTIIEYSGVFTMTHDRLDDLKCVLNFDKLCNSTKVSKEMLLEYMKKNNIEQYDLYVWNIVI
jgi:hypothetical protein